MKPAEARAAEEIDVIAAVARELTTRSRQATVLREELAGSGEQIPGATQWDMGSVALDERTGDKAGAT